MFNKSYSNFVRATTPENKPTGTENKVPSLSGEEARKLYLEEVKNAGSSAIRSTDKHILHKRRKSVRKEVEVELTSKDLLITVQNNDVDKLINVLDKYPDKINILDDFGWSLLMIACQANSIESVKELLKRGIDISVRDKAGNSARSLVIKNKNYVLADVLLNHKKTEIRKKISELSSKTKSYEEYVCSVCNKSFPNKEEHLSSTIHNISASKDKNIPANYVIPASNKGYQLMLKGGWDRDSGLGRDGTGKKYPIKAVPKKDRHGLGHENNKLKEKAPEDNIKHKSRKMFAANKKNNRIFEINFRRQFY